MNIISAKGMGTGSLNVLVYGDSGVGKTTLLSTAPGPVLVLDMEAGTLPLQGKDVDILTVSSPDDISEVFKELKNGTKYKTVALDSITEMHRVIMAHVIKSNPTISRAYGDQPSMSDYGRVSELMRRTLRAFRDLDMHVIFTALAQDQKDEVNGSLTRLPLLPGKLAYEVAGYMDIVGYMVAQENKEGDIKRGVAVQPQGRAIAKDRSGKLGSVVVPDIKAWIKAVDGKGKK